ncbi:helix-turn-helix domain-containing protein [Clostridium sp.]|jgi:excisionase family DNA binding protein|uniref:helix-turn-helix domain-containing protein n=1 Tax=Clostridium sp. TaxID=1506 RepID=UPI002FDE4746
MEKYKSIDGFKGNTKKVILVSPIEAMEILGVGRNTMYENLLKRKDFPSFKLGTKYFINAELLQEWANKQCGKK